MELLEYWDERWRSAFQSAGMGSGLNMLWSAGTPYGIVGDLLSDFLLRQVGDYQPDDQISTSMKDDGSKWRCLSAVQKAVRRGHALHAKRAAHAVHSHAASSRSHLWHRIAVIALEDVGLADPMMTAVALTAASSRAWRDEAGPRRLLFWLLDQMSAGVKSRMLCDVVSSPSLEAEDAAWLKSLPPAEFWAEVDREEVPALLRYVVRRGMACGGEGMEFAVLPAWLTLRGSVAWTEQLTLPEPVIVANLPAEAMDMHCHEGKRALAYFAKACPPVHRMLERHSVTDRIGVLGGALFEAEGGVLDRRMAWEREGRDSATWDAHRRQRELAVLPEGCREELVALIVENMPTLNYARRRVADAEQAENKRATPLV